MEELFRERSSSTPEPSLEELTEERDRARADADAARFLSALIKLLDREFTSLSTEDVRGQLTRLGAQVSQESQERLAELVQQGGDPAYGNSFAEMAALGEEMQHITDDDSSRSKGDMVHALEALKTKIQEQASARVRAMGQKKAI